MSDISPEQFAKMVADASDKEIEATIAEAGVRETLDRIFAGFEERFRPERAEGVDATVQWRIKADGDEHPYAVKIAGGSCVATREEADDPTTTMSIKLVPFVKLITGQADGMRLLMTRKLKVSGDLMFAQRMQGFFSQPKAE